MKPLIFFFVFTGVLAGCASTIDESEYFRVTGFNQGKMKEVAGEWQIYEKGEKLSFETNGECNYNGQISPCMWHGFILSYETNIERPTLNCKLVSNTANNYGNPEEVLAEDTNYFEIDIPLDGKVNVFVNPQYILTPVSTEFEWKIVYNCSFNGEEVLIFLQHVLPENKVI